VHKIMTITLTREEAQQVLDALECMNEGAFNAEIKLLRARLSAPEPSIVEDAIVYGTGITMGGKRIDPASIYKEPEPEPVVWRTRRNDTWSYHHNKPHGIPHEPLYAAECMPDDLIATYEKGFADGKAKREWQGLTENEKELLWDEAVEGQEHFCSQYGNFADTLEAKLKEKNA
jgi:hypothetical protein